ncbi:MAG TPA: A/G-specific adenine glycosylase [Chloroflexota bacterium]|nr:A/G-specific adenine glycosylase [Chloroflexota bacterium]
MTGSWSGEERFTKRVEEFRHEVLHFFHDHGRDLPWRQTRDPYRILVSEIMLQQTQVSRVLPFYTDFLERFPDVETLSRASEGDVIRTWQGLGYNRRAVYLKRAASSVCRQHGGEFPRGHTDLESLPGVGPYTAKAIACFAFDQQVAVVETNVRKAIRYFAQSVDPLPQSYAIDELADLLLPQGNAWEWNQAMIDFGALKVPPMPKTRPSQPAVRFEETDRFWRGRILANLCEQTHAVSVARLIRELPEERDEYRVMRLIDALAADGLIRHDSETNSVQLP